MRPPSSINPSHRFKGDNDIWTDVMTTFHAIARYRTKKLLQRLDTCWLLLSPLHLPLFGCASNGERFLFKVTSLTTDTVDCDGTIKLALILYLLIFIHFSFWKYIFYKNQLRLRLTHIFIYKNFGKNSYWSLFKSVVNAFKIGTLFRWINIIDESDKIMIYFQNELHHNSTVIKCFIDAKLTQNCDATD